MLTPTVHEGSPLSTVLVIPLPLLSSVPLNVELPFCDAVMVIAMVALVPERNRTDDGVPKDTCGPLVLSVYVRKVLLERPVLPAVSVAVLVLYVAVIVCLSLHVTALSVNVAVVLPLLMATLATVLGGTVQVPPMIKFSVEREAIASLNTSVTEVGAV